MKQETINVLEGLKQELTSLREEVRQLKEQVGKQPPTTVREYIYPQPVQLAGNRCPNCGQWYYNAYHFCWYVNPNRWAPTITWSTVTDTTSLKVNGDVPVSTGTITVSGTAKYDNP